MKIFTKLRVAITAALLIGGMASVWGQQLPTTSLYKHGTNSHSAGATVNYELTDSVTVGAVLDYFVMPDALYNPSYVPATSLTANLVSTFSWSVAPAGPVIAAKGTFLTNYKTVTWPGTTGSYTLSVAENGGAGCIDGTGKNIPVTVISKPTANFSSATITECSATPATHSRTLPLSLFTDMNHGNVIVNFQVVFTPASGLPTTTPYNNIIISESGTLDLEDLIGTTLAYGKYEVSIVSVRDRISVKSNVAGTVGGTPLFTYNLIRLPQTGEIYHLPNN